jgi:hypothetical protein
MYLRRASTSAASSPARECPRSPAAIRSSELPARRLARSRLVAMQRELQRRGQLTVRAGSDACVAGGARACGRGRAPARRRGAVPEAPGNREDRDQCAREDGRGGEREQSSASRDGWAARHGGEA